MKVECGGDGGGWTWRHFYVEDLIDVSHCEGLRCRREVVGVLEGLGMGGNGGFVGKEEGTEGSDGCVMEYSGGQWALSWKYH